MRNFDSLLQLVRCFFGDDGVAQRDVHGRGPLGERGLDLRDHGGGAPRPRELEAPQRQPAVLGELVEVLEQRVADVRASH